MGAGPGGPGLRASVPEVGFYTKFDHFAIFSFWCEWSILYSTFVVHWGLGRIQKKNYVSPIFFDTCKARGSWTTYHRPRGRDGKYLNTYWLFRYCKYFSSFFHVRKLLSTSIYLLLHCLQPSVPEVFAFLFPRSRSLFFNNKMDWNLILLIK